MSKKILLGDEAVAQAALDAGIKGAFSYPGTPATEILEYVQRENKPGVHSNWSPNEKVAYEEALGLSYLGHRALVSMKHVGVNVAADPFVNSALLEINGGLVLAVADDPGLHSSQNEQDSRFYARFAQMPCFEPTTQQDCYDMTRAAFDYSEKYRIPVMVRLVTRLAHSRSQVDLAASNEPAPEIRMKKNKNYWILIPAVSARRVQVIQEKVADFQNDARTSEFNKLDNQGQSDSIGIITSGITYNYVREACAHIDCSLPLLKIGFYPLAEEQLLEFIEPFAKIIVIEEGYSLIESTVRSLYRDKEIHGKHDAFLPPTGELDPDSVSAALTHILKATKPKQEPKSSLLSIPRRPPELCKGCSHRDTYAALNQALKGKKDYAIFGDIGCYTLGYLPPFEALDTTVNMGASIGMAKGAADGGLKYSIAIIGDSTFLHTGINGLLGAAAENSPLTVLILNNSTTGMTGGQPIHMDGEKLYNLIAALGVEKEHLKVVHALPNKIDEMAEVIATELEYRGLSVVIPQRPCIQIAKKST